MANFLQSPAIGVHLSTAMAMYVYSGDDVVLVDPTSRRVVQVID
jgi:hypothetical protein